MLLRYVSLNSGEGSIMISSPVCIFVCCINYSVCLFITVATMKDGVCDGVVKFILLLVV